MYNINTINVDVSSIYLDKGSFRFIDYKFEANDIFVKRCEVCNKTEIKYKNIPEGIFKNMLVDDSGWIRVNYYATPKGAHSLERLGYNAIETKNYNGYADQIWIPVSNFKELYEEKSNLKFVALRQDRFDLSFGQNLINSLNFPLARIYAGNAGRFILASSLKIDINSDINVMNVMHSKCKKVSLLVEKIMMLTPIEFEEARIQFNRLNENRKICYSANKIYASKDYDVMVDNLLTFNWYDINIIEDIYYKKYEQV